ncbi:DUF2470 domain-containing protein [Amycolatopsis antarctica]|uniref:DUF2470 domain-containing protein n=1 Tax=Amycolatopsis antarctica TaxID=1854586 RepID=A0A263D3Z0_9PSEU|nr:DUF2470 domain-containing protein [Amycolatopsis antarctica]OZM73160.1 DUF2470 domain-containing protein [Amycolatopsis antarctica]
MTETPTRRPPAPSPAERAKTIATRGGPAAIMPSAAQPDLGGMRFRPVLQHVHASGSVSVVLPEDNDLAVATREAESSEFAAMLELTDEAPLDLRERVRGLLWVTGWLRVLDDRAARARALAIADIRPDERLLDVGHGLSVLRLTPISLVIADADGTHSLQPQAFSRAVPDPFHGYETQWLRHLEDDHPDVVDQLSLHIPEHLRDGHVRPLGVDRYGLRLRVEASSGDHDVRLAFSRPVDSPPQLAMQLQRLLGCPFLAQTP